MIIVHDKLLEYGGAEYVLKELVKGFNPRYVFTPCVVNIEKWEKILGCKIRTLKIFKFINTQKRYRIFYPLLAFLLFLITIQEESSEIKLYYSSSLGKYVNFKNRKNRILYSNYPFKGVINTRKILKNYNIFVIYFILTLSYPMRILEYLALRKFERIAVISKSAQEAYRHTFNVEVSKIIHCPVDVDRLRAIQPSVWEEEKQILIICRMYVEKGVEDLLGALHDLSGISVVVIGDGPELSRYKEKFQNIQFVGFVSDEEKFKRLQSSHILLNPTAQEWSLTTVEANCAGRPVVSVACDAIKEINQCISKKDSFPNQQCSSDYLDLENVIKNLQPFDSSCRDVALLYFSPDSFIERMRCFTNE